MPDDMNQIILKDEIIDRRSRYTLVAFRLDSERDHKRLLKDLKKDIYFARAAHNSFAYRVKMSNGMMIEWKNDDWETWVGMIILREMQRVEAINMMIVVTRHYWGIKLQSDRFVHPINICQIFFQRYF